MSTRWKLVLITAAALALGACQGQPGAQGEKGGAGEQGAAGAAGEKGDKGDQGVAGTDGAMGPAGPAGAKGDPGPAGAALSIAKDQGSTASCAGGESLVSAYCVGGPGLSGVRFTDGNTADCSHIPGSSVTIVCGKL